MKKLVFLLLLVIGVAQAQTVPSTRFDQVIDANFTAGEPGGVALVAQHGHVLYECAFGMADLQLGVKMQPDMVFQIASMTKQFTAVCILQLAERGKLGLQDNISRYIAGCPEAWSEITIEHLLTHTSGIKDRREALQLQEFGEKEQSPGALIDLFKADTSAFAPGTRWAYSNSGYMVLGYILEKVSGMSYGAYLEKNIFGPLQMDHSGYRAESVTIVPGLVSNYVPVKDGFGNANLGYHLPFSAGGIYSTVEDMLKWNQGLLAGKVVKKEALAKAWTSYVLADGRPAHYGYGWQVDGTIQGSPTIEHSGNIPGFMSDGLYLAAADIYVVVLLNRRDHGEGLAELVAGQLASALLGKRKDLQEIVMSDDSLKTYTGFFATSQSSAYHIVLLQHRLYCQKPDGSNRFMLIPYAAGRFYSDNAEISFSRDAGGQISSFTATNTRHPAAPVLFKKTDKPLN